MDHQANISNDSVGVTTSPEVAKKRRIWPWIALAAGLLVVLLAVAAAIFIPKYLHAQRVAEYNATMKQVENASSETHRLLEENKLLTVLYALQFEEVQEFQVDIEELSEYSDHYFSDDDRAALSQVSDDFIEFLQDKELNEEEVELVDSAQETIVAEGYVWQTDFLNLDTDSVQQLVDTVDRTPIALVAEDDVTDEVVEQAKADLEKAEAELAEAEQKFAAASDRSDRLTSLVIAALEPLSSSALSAPAQAEVVHDMYPDADKDIVKDMRESANIAKESVTAELFTVDDDYNPVPIIGEAKDDEVFFSVTDAWRAVIISIHLKNYSSAITGAWISDAGSVEEALGFNPYLPFF
ncbi:MAG TPA: hypothetical protein VLZ31_07430 [Microbacteriaceae bacterium]|nr:hypothetical protein [Microbacteriaceae bacterium]